MSTERNSSYLRSIGRDIHSIARATGYVASEFAYPVARFMGRDVAFRAIVRPAARALSHWADQPTNIYRTRRRVIVGSLATLAVGYYLGFKSNEKGDQPSEVKPAATPARTPQPETKPQTQSERPNRYRVRLFNQLGEGWAENHPLWNKYWTCGPTTFAMALKTFGVETNPREIDKLLVQNGLRDSQGTLFRDMQLKGGAQELLNRRYNLKFQPLADILHPTKKTPNFEEIKKELDNNKLVIMSGQVKWIQFPGSPSANHIFGVKDVKQVGGVWQYQTFDPWGGEEAWRTMDDLAIFYYAWSVAK